MPEKPFDPNDRSTWPEWHRRGSVSSEEFVREVAASIRAGIERRRRERVERRKVTPSSG